MTSLSVSTNALTRRLLDDIIKYLADGGIILIDIDAPDFSRYLKPANLRHLARGRRPERYKKLLRYLIGQKLVSLKTAGNSKTKITLSSQGVKRAQKITLAQMSIPRPRSWDRRWRLVLFDIPEERRSARNALSLKLRAIGFYQLQKSIWVYPFPCAIEIEFIKHVYNIAPFVTYAEISKIDSHSQLMRRFAHLLPRRRIY